MAVNIFPQGTATLGNAGVFPVGSRAIYRISGAGYGGSLGSITASILAVGEKVNYKLISFTSSAKPGQVITFWGSGLGAADSDTAYTSTPHGVTVPNYQLQVDIGNLRTTIV